MKKLSCDLCEAEFEAADFDGWFGQMKIHYMADHADVMKDMQANYTKEDGEKWMSDARARFDAA